MKSIIHAYKSKEPMLQVNAFAIETAKVLFERAMMEAYSNCGCQFMLGLSADAVGKELRNPKIVELGS